MTEKIYFCPFCGGRDFLYLGDGKDMHPREKFTDQSVHACYGCLSIFAESEIDRAADRPRPLTAEFLYPER